MGDCCGRPGYQKVFSDQFAKRVARTYRKRGLDPTQRRMVSFLIEHGITGASVLEIGGGVGEMQIELLSRGAREATNLEISRSYEAEAATLLAQSGMTNRVKRRFVDIRRPWLADLVIWRAKKSERVLQRMSGVLNETSNPGNLVSFKGLRRLLVE